MYLVGISDEGFFCLSLNVDSENLFGGRCFVLRNVVQKVRREMVGIRYFVVDWTNLQLVVLKILTGVSCEDEVLFVVGFVCWDHRGCFFL